MRRHLDNDGVATPRLGSKALLGKLRHHAWHIGIVLIDLVNCNNNGHFGRTCVADCFDRLRHHAVVGGDHQHNDVGDLRTTRAHFGECSVTWSVDEGNRLAVLFYLVCTDVLRNAACLTSDNTC